MQYYTIPPFEHLELDTKAQHYLVVAQWVERSEALLHFYKKRAKDGAKIILDNGMHEFREVYPVDKYLEMAKDIGVEILVAPDAWKDAEATKYLVEDFMDVLSEEETRRFQIMGVPHGEDLMEFMNCYEELNFMCDILGLAKDEWGDKTGFIRPFFTWNLPRDDGQEPHIHLLGLTHVNELACCNLTSVRSFDTSLPYKAAMVGEIVQPDTVFSGKYDVDAKMTEEHQQLALGNCEELRRLANCPKEELWTKVT